MSKAPTEGPRARRIVFRSVVTVIAVVVISLIVARTIQAFPKPFNSTTKTSQTTVPATITPPGLLSKHDSDTIGYLANQISQAGVPIRVVIREVPQMPVDVGADANERANFYPVESKKGADDGLLMLVEVPGQDVTRTQVAFVTGKNFYPKGGLTYQALMDIMYQRIQPEINQKAIGTAVIDGLNWIAWTNQFESSPRLQPSSWQHRVGRVVDGVLAPLLGLYALALIVMGSRSRVRARRKAAQPDHAPDGRDIPRDSVHLGALSRGRVDDPVMVGVLLQLSAQRAIAVRGKGNRASSIQLLDASRCQTRTQRQMYDLLTRIADREDGRISAAMLRQLPDLWTPIRRQMASQFETSGLFTVRVLPAERRLQRLCLLGLVLAAMILVIATLSMARWGILAGGVVALVVAVVWWLSHHRQFATNAGRSTVHSPDRYLPRNESEAVELSIFRWIVTLDLSPSRLLGGSGSAANLAEEGVHMVANRLSTTVLGSYGI